MNGPSNIFPASALRWGGDTAYIWGVGDPVGSGGWQSDQVGLIERLLPHVRQFVCVRQALAAADALGAGLPGLLDNDRIGAVQLDRTIHFMSKYADARREGLDPPEAVRAAFRTVGHALWTTSAILALGFLVFASSGFELSWALGLLTAITIGFALIADFLLLPPLLMALDRRKS